MARRQKEERETDYNMVEDSGEARSAVEDRNNWRNGFVKDLSVTGHEEDKVYSNNDM